jgi:hypothetical protein
MHHSSLFYRHRSALRTAAAALICILLASPMTNAAAPGVTLCHIGVGDADDFQTVTVTRNEAVTHLEHGDVEGPCEGACATLCDDDNPCTVDACVTGTLRCVLQRERPPLMCDDGNVATLDRCDAAAGGCTHVPRLSVESRSVETTGTLPLRIILSANAQQGERLTFSTTRPAAGSISDPVPIHSPGTCSESIGTTCNRDSDCPASQVCGLPFVSSATVTYKPEQADIADSFEFTVKLANDPAIRASATVSVNPFDPSPAPDEPVQTVIANDAMAETVIDTAVTIRLSGDAPCEEACDSSDVSLTFLPTFRGPAGGRVSELTQGLELPQRTATIVYTPNPEFTGRDSLEFEACGRIEGVDVCDAATAFINVDNRMPLSMDQEVNTQRGQAVVINLARVKANLLFAARLARAVQDVDEDGAGDYNTIQRGPLPALAAAALDIPREGASKRITRIHLEWDISRLAGLHADLEEAQVVLSTEQGEKDSLNTQFFIATQDNDGILTDSDFQAAMEELPVASMAASAETAETSGTFTFDVLNSLKAALLAKRHFFAVQGRVNELLIPQGTESGLKIRTTTRANRAAGLEPKLSVITSGFATRILKLPGDGELYDALGDAVVVDEDLPSPRVTYLPAADFIGTDRFDFRVTDGETVETATVKINVIDTCAQVGRAANCAPGAAR